MSTICKQIIPLITHVKSHNPAAFVCPLALPSRYAPFGIIFLVMGKILGIENMQGMAKGLGLYMLTVITGLLIHLVITLAGIYVAITRRNPYKFFHKMLPAFLTALGTGSSSGTLPVTFR